MQIPKWAENPKVIGAVLGGVVMVYIVTRNGTSQTATGSAIINTEPDSGLVALGMQMRMQDNQNAADYTQLQANNTTMLALASIDAGTENKRIDLLDRQSDRDYQLTNNLNNQNFELSRMDAQAEYERVVVSDRMSDRDFQMNSNRNNQQYDLGKKAIEAGVNETNQAYNLANYQAMIQHDLGKKGIKAGSNAAILGNISSIATAFMGI